MQKKIENEEMSERREEECRGTKEGNEELEMGTWKIGRQGHIEKEEKGKTKKKKKKGTYCQWHPWCSLIVKRSFWRYMASCVSIWYQMAFSALCTSCNDEPILVLAKRKRLTLPLSMIGNFRKFCATHWFCESQWNFLLPHVFSILKIGAEWGDEVPFLIPIPTYPKFLFAPTRMKINGLF